MFVSSADPAVTVADRLRVGPIHPPQAIVLLEQVLSELARVHATGTVHGDISVETVVIGATGKATLRDAREPKYRHRRSDLRAVGVLAYAMVTGDVSGEVRPALAPPRFEAWIRRCTSRLQPFPDADAAAAALISDRTPSSRTPLLIGLVASGTAVAVLGLWARPATSPRDAFAPTASLVQTTAKPVRTRPPLPTGAIEPPDSPLPPAPTMATFVPPPRSEPVMLPAPTTAFATVPFSAESTWIEDPAVYVLEDVFRRLAKNPLARVEVSGHSSSDGEADRIRIVSTGRAMSVQRYLVARGIDEHRIDVVSRGASAPIASNETADGRARNRRVELRLLP